MPTSERELREDLAPTTERAVPSLPEGVAAVPAAILRMQAMIGNRATSGLLARDGRARESAPTKEKPPPAPDNTVMVDGLGRYKVHSFNRASDTSVSVMLDAGKDAAKLHAAAGTGKPIATVTITTGGHTITLHNVIIAGIHEAGSPGSDPVTVVELDAQSTEFD